MILFSSSSLALFIPVQGNTDQDGWGLTKSAAQVKLFIMYDEIIFENARYTKVKIGKWEIAVVSI